MDSFEPKKRKGETEEEGKKSKNSQNDDDDDIKNKNDDDIQNKNVNNNNDVISNEDFYKEDFEIEEALSKGTEDEEEEDLTYDFSPVQKSRYEEGTRIMKGVLFARHRLLNMPDMGISDIDLRIIFYSALGIPFRALRNISGDFQEMIQNPFVLDIEYEIDDQTLLQSQNLNSLWEINMTNNLLKTFPAPLLKIGSLTRLSLKKNLIQKLSFNNEPLRFLSLSCLQSLDLSDNALSEIPESLLCLPSLVSLNLSHNRITQLPEKIDLPKIKLLSFAHNEISILPSLEKCVTLWELRLRENKLKALPRGIWNCTSLKTIDVSFNELLYLPYISDPNFLRKLNLIVDNNPWNFQEMYEKENQAFIVGQSPPSLKEITARSIIKRPPKVKKNLPYELIEYFKQATPCENKNCPEAKIYFESYIYAFQMLEIQGKPIPFQSKVCGWTCSTNLKEK